LTSKEQVTSVQRGHIERLQQEILSIMSTVSNRQESLLTKRPFWYSKVFFVAALPITLYALTIVFGFLGFEAWFREKHASETNPQIVESQGEGYGDHFWDEAILNALLLPLAESIDVDGPRVPASLQFARVTGYLTAATAILGIFITWLEPRIQRIRPRFFGRGRFAVVCGLGWKGHELALDYLRSMEPNVLELFLNRRFRCAWKQVGWCTEPRAHTTPPEEREGAASRMHQTLMEINKALRGRAEATGSIGPNRWYHRLGAITISIISYYPRIFSSDRLIVVDNDPQNRLREDLILPWVVHLVDDATLEKTLFRARIPDATMLHIVTDDDEVNCRIALQAMDVLSSRLGKYSIDDAIPRSMGFVA